VTGATRGTQGVAAGPAPVGEAEESDGSRVPASKIRALVGSSRRLAGQIRRSEKLIVNVPVDAARNPPRQRVACREVFQVERERLGTEVTCPLPACESTCSCSRRCSDRSTQRREALWGFAGLGAAELRPGSSR